MDDEMEKDEFEAEEEERLLAQLKEHDERVEHAETEQDMLIWRDYAELV